MDEKIENRLKSLINEGKGHLQTLIVENNKVQYWTRSVYLSHLQSWISSSANIVNKIIQNGSPYEDELKRILTDRDLQDAVPSHTVQKLQGLLESIKSELDHGVLKDIEYIAFASAYDDFLDHAEHFHKGGKLKESSILSSTILEDTLSKIALKNGIDPSKKGLEELIDALIKNNVFTPVKGKRYKGLTGVRNHAFHAEWDKYDLRDVGEQIKGIRGLITDYL